jgi:translocation and assembly module TamA
VCPGYALVLVLGLIFFSTDARSQAPVQVDIRGLGGDMLENVTAALEIYRRRGERLSAATIEALHAKAEVQIRRALQPYGYYAPSVRATLTPPGPDVAYWVARYELDTGSPVPIARLETGLLGPGADDPSLAALVEQLPLAEGDALRHLEYERAKRELLTQIHALGYPDAVLSTHQVVVDMQAYAAAVELNVDTGPLYVIGPISFEQDRFAQSYLRRHLVLEPGEPFNQEAIARQRRVLTRSGHFQAVEVLEGPPSADPNPAIPLEFRLTPFKANRYRAQLGWGTDTGAGIQADWNRRYIGRHGHRFGLGVSAVEDQSRLAGDLRYSIPLEPLTGERLELALRHQSRTITAQDVELEDGGETRILNNLVSAYWHFAPSQWGDFEVSSRAGLSAVGESYDIFDVLFGNLSQDDQDFLAGLIGEDAVATLAPDFEALVPSVRWTARRADNRLYIRDGDYFQLELRAANQSLGSNVDFWQAQFNSWTIRPVGAGGRVLLRTALGYSDAQTEEVLGAKFNQMPELYEFRAGGARSVRGYRFERLFPSDAITGGKHQLIGSLEYEHEVYDSIGLAAFVDAGNAFNDWDDIDEKIGVGLGLRWRSPVGAVRVDFAFPLDESDESFQVYFTVGPEF